MDIAARLRELADDIENNSQGESDALYKLARAELRIRRLEGALDLVLAGEHLSTVAGLRKEVARLNGLLNAYHESVVSESAMSYEAKAQQEARDERIRSGGKP